MERLYKNYKDKAAIYIVYVREAHPEDGWQSRKNVIDKIIVNQPKTYTARCNVADRFVKDKKITIPCLIDNIKNTVNNAYGAAPDRHYVIDIDGKIALKGARGPWGFKVADAEKALKTLLANKGKMTKEQAEAPEPTRTRPNRRNRRRPGGMGN